MSKQKRNTTVFLTKEKIIMWRVEWSFPSSDVPVKVFEARLSENTPLFEALRKYTDYGSVCLCDLHVKFGVTMAVHIIFLLSTFLCILG